MSAPPATVAADERPGRWVLALADRVYDRRGELTVGERDALEAFAALRGRGGRVPRHAAAELRRLVDPVDDVLAFVAPRAKWWGRLPARSALVNAMHAERLVFWAWDRDRWVGVIGRTDADVRQLVMAVAYLLCDQRDLHREFPGFKRGLFARRVFGTAAVDESLARVRAHLDSFGYAATLGRPGMSAALFELMLAAGSPLLEDVAAQPQALAALHARERAAIRHGAAQLASALVGIGVLERSPLGPGSSSDEAWIARSTAPARGVPEEWAEWVARWFCTSTLSRRTREHNFYSLLKAGRWIAEHDPAATRPDAWRREHATAWVAAVDRMRIGDYANAQNLRYMRAKSGGALGANSKAQHINTLRSFFIDLQEWEWIERRFDPRRVMTVPRSVSALIGPEPRVIADDVWAKLLWAGLNLTDADLPRHHTTRGESWYPLALVRAIALLWLFGGLRNDEIVRLRVGAIRWQHDHPDGAGSDGVANADAQAPVCLLDVPTNKIGTRFTKPVDRLVGEAIEQWEAVRAPQPTFVDEKTAETVDFLFVHRGARIGRHYINRSLIGVLCKKAGVPRLDVRGSITSHRARATIASQLYNAKDPMSLFELQAWLGHSSPESTRHYARITPTTLARAYTDAGYFQRNLRTIEVLLDRDAVQSGAAGSGEPYEFYDLGHGYCSYSFFEQCPHRMACARCDFYLPKHSTRGQLLEADTALQRMLVEIPLTEDEQGAVEDDQRAVRRCLTGLPIPRRLPARRHESCRPSRPAASCRCSPARDPRQVAMAEPSPAAPGAHVRSPRLAGTGGWLPSPIVAGGGRIASRSPRLPSPRPSGSVPRPAARRRDGLCQPPAPTRRDHMSTSAPAVNSITLVGNLTADPVLREIAHGRKVCDMRLAVNDQRDQPPLFIDVATFGASAEARARYLAKGRQIAVTGRLIYREWEADDGPLAASTPSSDACASAAAPTARAPKANRPPTAAAVTTTSTSDQPLRGGGRGRRPEPTTPHRPP